MENDKVKNLATLIATAEVDQDSEIGNDNEEIFSYFVTVNEDLAFIGTITDRENSEMEWEFIGADNQERTVCEALKLGVSPREYWSIVEPLLNVLVGV